MTVNIRDLEAINKLVKIRERCATQLRNVEVFLKKIDDDGEDSGAVEGFDEGYWCCVSEHSDGSGKQIDLTGCYVAREVVMATYDVIETQIEAVDAKLMEMGVEVSL